MIEPNTAAALWADAEHSHMSLSHEYRTMIVETEELSKEADVPIGFKIYIRKMRFWESKNGIKA